MRCLRNRSKTGFAAVIFLVSAVTGVFGACGGSQPPGASPETMPEAGPKRGPKRMPLLITESDHVGLKNLGNTCYANATFQMLAGSPRFMNRLENVINGPAEGLRRSLGKFLTQFWERQLAFERSTPMRSEVGFASAIREVFKQFNALGTGFQVTMTQQEDAEEFLTSLLGAFDLSLDIRVGARVVFNNGEARDLPFSDESILRLAVNDATVNSVATALNFFHRLTLRSWPNQLQNNAGVLADSTVSGRLLEPAGGVPEEVFVQLLRFRQINPQRREKDSKVIEAFSPILLNFARANGAVEQRQYRPMTYIVHRGETIESGHYVAYKVDNSGGWRLYNDQIVSIVSAQTAINDIQANAYLILYRRL